MRFKDTLSIDHKDYEQLKKFAHEHGFTRVSQLFDDMLRVYRLWNLNKDIIKEATQSEVWEK